MPDEKPAGNTSNDNPTPEEVHERLERYLSETERLVGLLREGLEKGEEQLKALKAFDAQVSKLGGGIKPIETSSLEAEVENIRQHALSLDELHERIKNDIGKVEQISAKIADILGQYQ
ncbi:MAG: hypothetical protein HY435_02510 [Candidatus Liptonbacteria bacterium]|nr:hypothetical protein [Candidatus Liptonbacteria bacterium]